MFMPTQDSYYEMSAIDFEKYSLDILRQQTRGLENLSITHNVVIEKGDGNYQIDGVIKFSVIGVNYITLVECKHYKGAISREKVQVLYDKIRAILIATSNFQSGAIKYASEHGIALVQITEADTRFETRGRFGIVQARVNLYNEGLPYIGVMQESKDIGITCKYLRAYSTQLKDFLLGK